MDCFQFLFLSLYLMGVQSILKHSRVMDEFGEDGGEYAILTLAINSSGLLVGGREQIHHLSLDKISNQYSPVFASRTLQSRSETLETCLAFSNRDTFQCHNHIRLILQETDGSIIACGTNSFKPIVYRLNSLLLDITPATFEPGYCSPNPMDKSAGVVTTWNQEYPERKSSPYIGTIVSSGSKSATIYRPPSSHKRFLSVPSSRIDWLLEPTFIRTFETQHSVFFLITERSVEMWPLCSGEYDFEPGYCLQSRIIRVCKDDEGGQKFPFSNEWTSFTKARLICTGRHEQAIIFDHMVDAVKVRVSSTGKVLIYAAFKLKLIDQYVSVLCKYDVDEIERLFDTSALKSVDERGIWHQGSQKSVKCNSFSEWNMTGTVDRHVILNEIVRPNSAGVVLKIMDAEISQLTAKQVVSSENELVIMMGTSDGRLIKAVPKTANHHQLIIVSEWSKPEEPILSLVLTSYRSEKMYYTKYVYVGTSRRVYQLSTADQCTLYTTIAQCSQDVDCSWNYCDNLCLYIPKIRRLKVPRECMTATKDIMETIRIEELISGDKQPSYTLFLPCQTTQQLWIKDGLNVLVDNHLIYQTTEGILLVWHDESTETNIPGLYICSDMKGNILTKYMLIGRDGSAEGRLLNNTSAMEGYGIGQCIDDKVFLNQYNRWCEQLEKYEQTYLKWQSLKEQTCEYEPIKE